MFLKTNETPVPKIYFYQFFVFGAILASSFIFFHFFVIYHNEILLNNLKTMTTHFCM